MSTAPHTPDASPMPAASRSRLVSAFKDIVSAEGLLTEDDELIPYESDGLAVYRQRPAIVVLPETVEQIQAILRTCHSEQVPVIARGAGTGLSGGALPRPDAVTLGLGKFNKILSIDEHNGTATVQPGVRNLAISEAAAEHGLYYAPDPSSQIACSIGGNVAENAGGVHCLKYGLTVHNVLQVDIVTIDGERIRLGSCAPDTAGYDLLALLHGSEGLLGVVVEVVVKLLPEPPVAKVLLAAFDDVERAGDCVADIIAAGIVPAGLEMMDKAAILAADDFAKCGYPRDAEALFLCELDGVSDEVDEQMQQVIALLRESGATEWRVARDETERAIFWKGRKSAFPAVGRISPDYYCMDGTIPRRHLGTVLKRMDELSEEYRLKIANVFHAGDGNLHPLILFDASKPGELERTEELGGKILSLCVEVGGTITGEHGVGVEKINQMCEQFSSEELEQFHAVKAAFDESGLLNPGKAIPTLQRCAEFGALHVHKGQLPHPELERF